MITKSRNLPISRMQEISHSGVFIKRFDSREHTEMKPHAHRDDYYIIVIMTDGEAEVDIDFERKTLHSGDLLIISPWQVHNQKYDYD